MHSRFDVQEVVRRQNEARRQAEDRITELQNELIHVARLSAMGELASALAHELNQPLTAVSNYANAARRLLDDSRGSDPDTACELLMKASEGLITYGRPCDGRFDCTDAQ